MIDLKCPIDGEVMEKEEHDGVTLLRCPKCYGAFFTQKEQINMRGRMFSTEPELAKCVGIGLVCGVPVSLPPNLYGQPIEKG